MHRIGANPCDKLHLQLRLLIPLNDIEQIATKAGQYSEAQQMGNNAAFVPTTYCLVHLPHQTPSNEDLIEMFILWSQFFAYPVVQQDRLIARQPDLEC